jgi:hypothetical protein
MNWHELSFQEKLLKSHRAVLFPDEIDKNTQDFVSMIIERLIDKTGNMNNEEIEKFLGYG